MIPYDKSAYDLLQRGALALAKVESAGLNIDIAYLDKAIEETKEQIAVLKCKQESSRVWREWRKIYGGKMNYTSNDQLGEVLFNRLGFTAPDLTATGKFKTDEKSLSKVDHSFVRRYLKIKKLDKALTTYLLGLRREVQGGKIRPFFNLHTALTFRSSSDSPNFQNIPVRNEKIGKLIRSAFVAAPGNQLVEIDYGGIEVCIAACYHKDPAMLSYIKDPSKDMHRDMAMECYMLPENEVTKKIRYCGKNMFVFPQFYGDWYVDCAKHLWSAMDELALTTTSGVLVKDLLEDQGITRLGELNPNERPEPGTFEHHIKKVEEDFWGRRFSVYSKWKKRWYKEYLSDGYFLTKTGFICQGYMKRNEVINYPVQGSAFHCLLWSLIQLVLEEVQKHKMRARIVGQIHDSIVADVPKEEVDDFLVLANNVMTKKLLQAWKWIVVPLEIEAEVSPLGASWNDKKVKEIPS